MWGELTTRITLVSVLLSMSCSAIAQVGDPGGGEGIDFRTALEQTLQKNPALIAFGYQLDAQRGRELQASIAPSPELNVMVENFGANGSNTNVDGTEVTLSLAWVLERGKQDSRVHTANARMALLQIDAEIKRLDVAAKTARLFLNCHALQTQLEQISEAVNLIETTAGAIQKRIAAGRAPDADLARAAVELARMQLERGDLKHELETAIRRLSAQWGVTQPGFQRVSGNLRMSTEPEAYAVLLERIDRNPNLQRYMTEQRLRESELLLAQANAKSNWKITTGVRYFEQTNDQAFVAGITIPLSIKNRNRGRIAEAQANLAFTNSTAIATRVEIETRLFALYQELQHSVHRAEVYRGEIIPKINEALADAKRAYELGRYSYIDLRIAQGDALRARSEAISAEIDAHHNRLEIERLTGTAVATPVDKEREKS